MTSIELVTLGEVADLQWGDTSVTKKSYVLTGGKYPAYSASGQDGFLPYFDYDRTGVILSAIGANAGKTWLATGKWSCIKNTIRFFSKDESVADTRYLYWATQSHATFPLRGSAQPFISQGDAREVAISLPPISEQRAIAATLGALDDKIESNRRIIGLIPRLVRAHVNSAISHSSTFISVSDLATFVNGGAYTKGATGTGRMVIRIAELNSGPGRSTVYNDIKVPDEKIARAGDILMSWSGSLGVYRWYRDEAIINQHIFKVSPTGYPAWLVFDRLNEVMSIFRGVAADKATTMGHIQRGHLISTNVEIPTQGALEELETKISPLWDRLLLAERENLDLEQLRDALLPELLSGRIHVTAEGAEA